MTNEPADSIAVLTAKAHDLETRYTLLQRTVELINEVVVEQGKKIDWLERKLQVVARQLGTLAEHEQEPRTLEDDKPPHY